MDEIHFGPKHDLQLPPRHWLVLGAVAVLIAGAVMLIITAGGGHHAPRPPGPSVAAPRPSLSPAAAPGTLLITCGSANWGGLYRNWRAGSLKIGPAWLVGGLSYVVRRGTAHAEPSMGTRHRRSGAVMIVEVSDGSTVVIKAASQASSHFTFVYGFNGPSGNPLPSGDLGFTLSSCPGGEEGPNGALTDFRLGFSIAAGGAAPVVIQTSASSRPIHVTFTSPHPARIESTSTPR